MASRKGRNASQKRKIKSKLMGSGQRAKCACCGKYFLEDELTIDHKIPLSKGGTWHFQNLQLMCRKCNQGKGNTWDLQDIFNAIKDEETARQSEQTGRGVDDKSDSVEKPKGQK